MRSKNGVLWLCLFFLATLSATPLCGQVEYEGPEHPIIEEMCTRAAKALEEYGDTVSGGENSVGEAVLIGLTILEVNKRYEGEVPKNNYQINRAVEETLDMVDGNGRHSLEKQSAMYTPCLATILLCEVDDKLYAPQIKKLVRYIKERQNENGGWGYAKDAFIVDVSQTQYCALALFIAKLHKFKVDPQVAKKALECLTRFQLQNGSWVYHYTLAGTPRSRTDNTPSLHTSALGTVYVLGDLLQLTPRARDMRIGAKNEASTLPPSVTVYVKPKEGEAATKEGPLVSFDRGRLGGTKSKGNRWLVENFTVDSNSWNYYYLYALERYAFFREQAEGRFPEVPNWYDQGVNHLRALQEDNGFYPRGQQAAMNPYVTTSLATLFLVRSSDLLVRPPAGSNLNGNIGFPEKGTLVLKNGKLTSDAALKGVANVMELLGSSDGEDARAILAGMKLTAESIGKGMSRSEKRSLLIGMVKDYNYIKRLIAVKVLAGEQNMDNVPALIYAVGDPSPEIAREAHNGLRLVSRRIDAFPLPPNALPSDFQSVKKKWENWFLTIRPDAEFFD